MEAADPRTVLDNTKAAMVKTLEHLEQEFQKIRAGKASPDMLEGIRVEYYGALTPLNQVATISSADARTLVIQPYESSLIPTIERAIVDAHHLGVTPQNDGKVIRISLPPLTEERRKKLVKECHRVAEDNRVAIRNHRRDANDALKKLQKDGLSEDEAKGAEAQVQKLTDEHIAKVDKATERKEADIMTV